MDFVVVEVALLSELGFEVAVPWTLCVGPLEHCVRIVFFEGHGFQESGAATFGFVPDIVSLP